MLNEVAHETVESIRWDEGEICSMDVGLCKYQLALCMIERFCADQAVTRSCAGMGIFFERVDIGLVQSSRIPRRYLYLWCTGETPIRPFIITRWVQINSGILYRREITPMTFVRRLSSRSSEEESRIGAYS